eukprot:CAMPEP_0117480462 /NCGR_PEP_ID=MMETSP0784-20121206/12403_1 /TAXON_ID=39447 /ORGANISM="" /LENGTH=193 /DNA_ID=CAMNT_0005274901 /DNA_START=52 /DNA_END=636 /DNA_ORIENTATION=+
MVFRMIIVLVAAGQARASALQRTSDCAVPMEEDQAISLLQKEVDLKPYGEEKEEFLLRARESMRKSALYGREATVLMDLYKVDQQLEEAEAKEKAEKQNATETATALPMEDVEQPEAEQRSVPVATNKAAAKAAEAKLDAELSALLRETEKPSAEGDGQKLAKAQLETVAKEASPSAFGGPVKEAAKEVATLG